jgi:phenylalanine ammonia-lyase
MNSEFQFTNAPLSIKDVKNFVFYRANFSSVTIAPETKTRIAHSEKNLHALLEKKIPIYGVTTGFGDSSYRFIDAAQSGALQENLVAYLNCGTGATLPEAATRASLLIRLNSLSRGYSGVSNDLIERMRLHLEKNWIPITPCEGSLGASGDLIPLAYLAASLQGKGQLHSKNGPVETAVVLKENNIEPYRLKPKEGLALVNGTSTMAGLALVNLNHAEVLSKLSILSTAWLCIAIEGRPDSFSILVNEKAKMHRGQSDAAKLIRAELSKENYKADPITKGPVQDRYSLRCAPQILGPVLETIAQTSDWLETEINSVSDNPLIDDDGTLQTGGNFYGGYLGHSMDYLKMSLAHLADMMDRQLMLLVDDKQNRGLPPNLANWQNLPEDERFLHHGLKGLHQSVSAITSEIMAKSIPNGIFSRSSESHNQDKVSLGMSSAVQCETLIKQLFHVQALYLICLAQAIDLRKIKFKSLASQKIYALVRKHVPFIERDQALTHPLFNLIEDLKRLADREGAEGIL